MTQLPLIDLADTPGAVAGCINEACRAHGFFYVVNHGVDEQLGARLEALSHRFFALPEPVKAQWAMPLGGRAWRGWFPLGGELTSGRPDWKEGLYIGTELPDDQRAILFGSIGVLVLMVAGADEMLGGGGFGVVLWVTLVLCAVIAIISVWNRAHSY